MRHYPVPKSLGELSSQQVQPPQWDTYGTPENVKHFQTLALALCPPTSRLVHHCDNLWTLGALQTFSKEWIKVIVLISVFTLNHSRCKGRLYSALGLKHSVICHLFSLLTQTNRQNSAHCIFRRYFKYQRPFLLSTYLIILSTIKPIY